jgi:hypothetical protein
MEKTALDPPSLPPARLFPDTGTGSTPLDALTAFAGVGPPASQGDNGPRDFLFPFAREVLNPATRIETDACSQEGLR